MNPDVLLDTRRFVRDATRFGPASLPADHADVERHLGIVRGVLNEGEGYRAVTTCAGA